MATQRDKDLIIVELEKAKSAYTVILSQVKRIYSEIKIIDEGFVKPLHEAKKMWGFTLFAGGLPLETLELTMRLEASIKQLDVWIKKTKKVETAS